MTLADVIVWLIRLLPRNLALKLRLRRVSPERTRPDIRHTYDVPGDTGGAWRPDYRMQDPSRDPREPYGGESSSAGNDHGWANCTMVAGALAYAYHVHDSTGPYGGDMRHSQNDLSGGTDLYDLEDAWDEYGGQDLKIKTGNGWQAVIDYHNQGRAIVIQGEGNVPGSATFTGGHACCIAPETNSEGKWLWGDPLASGWQWVSPSSIKEWAQAWHSGIAFAISADVIHEPEPPDPEPPEPIPPTYEYDPIKPVVIPSAWNPADYTPPIWGEAQWDCLAFWYIRPAMYAQAWAQNVPLWDSARWGGQWT